MSAPLSIEIVADTTIRFASGASVILRVVDGYPSYYPDSVVGDITFGPWGDNPRELNDGGTIYEVSAATLPAPPDPNAPIDVAPEPADPSAGGADPDSPPPGTEVSVDAGLEHIGNELAHPTEGEDGDPPLTQQVEQAGEDFGEAFDPADWHTEDGGDGGLGFDGGGESDQPWNEKQAEWVQDDESQYNRG